MASGKDPNAVSPPVIPKIIRQEPDINTLVRDSPFFTKVAKFFKLLDVDEDGLLTIQEAKQSLTLCYSAIFKKQRETDELAGREPKPDGNVQSTVNRQVKWLFSLAAPGDLPSTSRKALQAKPTSISLPDFVECYKKLLREDHEMEVLTLDLNLAIDALTHSKQSLEHKTGQFFERVAVLFRLLDTNKNGVLERSEATEGLNTVYMSLEVATSPVNDKKMLREKVESLVKQRVDLLFAPEAKVPHEENAQSITSEQFHDHYKRLLLDGQEQEVLRIDLERAIKALESPKLGSLKRAPVPTFPK